MEAERSFSLMNMIKTEQRNTLETSTVDDFMMINRNGPKIEDFQYEEAFDLWKKGKKRYFI